jgi:hypothetical protein
MEVVARRSVAGDDVAAEAGKAVGVAVQRAGRLVLPAEVGRDRPSSWPLLARSAAILEDQLKLPARVFPSDPLAGVAPDRA